MGIAFVLSFWALVWGCLAIAGSLAMGVVTKVLTAKVNGGKNIATVGAVSFPIICLGWGAAIFVFQAVVNVGYLHRDCGIGDGFWCPLPNQYEMAAIDELKSGTIFKQRAGVIGDAGVLEKGAIGGITRFQVSGHYILGDCYRQLSEQEALEDGLPLKEFFLLDGVTDKKTIMPTYGDLCQVASKLGIKPALQSFESAYDRYRFTAFDFSLIPLLVLPPIAGFVFLVRLILRMRNS